MTSIVFPERLVNTSPGFVALPPGHVLSGRDDSDNVQGQAHLGGRAQGREHNRSAGHIGFHVLHIVGRLD